MPTVRSPCTFECRTSARTEPADVAAQKQQVENLLHGIAAMLMLGDPHAPACNDTLGLHVDRCCLFELFACKRSVVLDFLPAEVADKGRKCFKTVGMGLDEIDV